MTKKKKTVEESETLKERRIALGVKDIEQLRKEDLEDLIEMLNWWRNRKETSDVATTEIRPVFKRGVTTARSVRLNQSMMHEAEQKAKQERIKTGGTFNGLVELLVWEYLGKPPVYVEESE